MDLHTYSQGKISGGQGGGARTDTDGHGRTRPTQPTRPTHPIHPNKTKVRSSPTREEARKAQPTQGTSGNERSSNGATRHRGGRASQHSHARGAGPRHPAAGPLQTHAGSRARGTARAPHNVTRASLSGLIAGSAFVDGIKVNSHFEGRTPLGSSAAAGCLLRRSLTRGLASRRTC